jgi:N-acyl-phosphatidylethanolamine-hydrolysing phospholipase D
MTGDQARVTVAVAVPPALAFEIFTAHIDRWWRRGVKFRHAGARRGFIAIEPRVGGRVFESIDADGGAPAQVVELGRVQVWDPPTHLSFSWRNAVYAPDEWTEVEVEFAAAPAGTEVTVTHRGLARLRADHPARHGLQGADYSREIGLWWGEQMSSLRRAQVPNLHHTPSGFRNHYVASVQKSWRELLRWQWQRRRAGQPPAPRTPTPTAAAPLDFLRENAAAGAAMVPTVTWIGHATAMVQASGLNVLTDPIFSQRASPFRFLGPRRVQPPGIALRDLPRIDVVVVSHNHYDHLDRDSIKALAKQPDGPPLFLVPLGVRAWMSSQGIERVAELDWWGHHEHGGVEFYFTPAQHWSARGIRDRNQTLWGAWSVLGADLHWFFSGDTGYSADFIDTRRHFAARQTAACGGGFDVALIAVGACEPRWFMREQHVNPEEAVQIHLDLGAKRSIGVHWGTFELSDEPLDHPLEVLPGARARLGVSEAAFSLLAIGQTSRLAPRP